MPSNPFYICPPLIQNPKVSLSPSISMLLKPSLDAFRCHLLQVFILSMTIHEEYVKLFSLCQYFEGQIPLENKMF